MRLRAALVAAAAGAALAAPAAPSRAEECSGVHVVVDFASLSGGAPARCAPGDPSSGVAALRGAGFEPTRVAQSPGYFVCRIDGKPASDPCQRTPPEDAYWSYWHARPGGSWTYSSKGAADHDPAPGSVEGWAFGAGDPPSVPPPADAGEPTRRPAPTAAPGGSSRPSASPAPAPARGSREPSQPAVAAPSPRRGATGVDRSPSAAASQDAGAGATAVPPSAGTAPATASPAAAAGAPAPGPEPRQGSGPPLGLLVAAALVGGLGVAAAVRARRAP